MHHGSNHMRSIVLWLWLGPALVIDVAPHTSCVYTWREVRGQNNTALMSVLLSFSFSNQPFINKGHHNEPCY